jgi:two-component system, LuxR family, response regulator FixJ
MSDQNEPVVHVVDDDEAVRESLEALLFVSGFFVFSYVSAEDFLARAPEDGGCLVLDVNMPGMSGLELLERLSRTGVRRPVVILTARRDDGLQELASSLGARRVLDKPVRKDELLAAIAAAL